jgi:hypothetical protein
MKAQHDSKQTPLERQIRASAPDGAVGFRLYGFTSGACYPDKTRNSRDYFGLTSFEWPLGVPLGTYQVQFVDQGGKPFNLVPAPTVKLASPAGTDPSPEAKDGEDSESAADEDEDQEGDKAQSKPNQPGDLPDLSGAIHEAATIENKKKRHKLVNKLNYAQEIATHYEVFDTMKNDMLRQVLTVSKITQQQTEMHLMMMGRLKEEYEKFKPHPVVEDTKHTWGLVATEALRTIGELGKTAMSSRAMMIAEGTRPALPARSADDDANKSVEQAAERAAKKAAAEIAAEAAQAKATAERAEEMLAEVLRRLDRMAEQRPAPEPVKASPEPVKASPEPVKASPEPVKPPPEPVKPPPEPVKPPPVAEPAATSQSKTTDGERKPKDDSDHTSGDPPTAPPPSSAEPATKAAEAEPATKATEAAPTDAAKADASRRGALVPSQNPYVKSWRSIKSFVRRMTDLDLMVFTSSVPMFRSFLAMLRALTPYYQGPTMSLDELMSAEAAT